MEIELGRIGIWHNADGLNPELVGEIERLGYGAIWIGGSPGGDLALAEELLDATSRIVVATGIVNMWTDSAHDVADAWRRVTNKHPGRFLLGVGVGHPEATEEYQQPYDKITSYLDELDDAGVPATDRVLAALGPKVLQLAARRARGAHPYLTTPRHTANARELLGPDVLLAPEQKIVLETDPQQARQRARPIIESYLELRNYANSLLRLGYTPEDVHGGGSDWLIDVLALHGDAETIAIGITAHLEAGADHVCIQAIDADPLPTYRAIAEAMQLGGSTP